VGYLREALESGSDEQIRSVVTTLNGAKARLLNGCDTDLAKQLGSDINTLKDLTRSRSVTAGLEYYVFSTITDDPKLLLMTGDLVSAASCQNYRSGSHIETLPAYVIDGNIKLALSYVLKKQQVDGALNELALRDGEKFEVRFDAARQALIFGIARSESAGATRSTHIALGKAIRREVLRLGGKPGAAVLFTERAYLRPHAIDGAIAKQQKSLVATVTKSIGASSHVSGSPTPFPPSRNYGGVYTDAGGGRKHGGYQI